MLRRCKFEWESGVSQLAQRYVTILVFILDHSEHRPEWEHIYICIGTWVFHSAQVYVPFNPNVCTCSFIDYSESIHHQPLQALLLPSKMS